MNRLIFQSLLSTGILYSSFSFAQEKATKLQTNGIFDINEKGALLFPNDQDKKKHNGYNKGVKEKVGNLVGKGQTDRQFYKE